VVIGALIFANYLTVSGAAGELQRWIQGFALSPMGLIWLLFVIYILLGCLLDASAMTVLTVPIFFPLVLAAGIDPVWFGIFVVIMVGIGMIHPPLGMLLIVVKALVPDMRASRLFYAIGPFLVGDAIRIALLIFFPVIVTFLPGLMR
jgi:TRAP-type C4-dicarboxylate transport system permease large subunit